MSDTSREAVKNYLLRCRNFVLRKSDGRVEVPKNLIKEMEWEAVEEVFLYKASDALLIYSSPERSSDTFLGKIAACAGRIRIPFGILNKIEFCDQMFSIERENECISIRPYNWYCCGEIDQLLDILGPLNIKRLSNFIFGSPINTDIECLLPTIKAEPIFLSDKKNNIFRVIGLPFKFSAFYIRETKEIILSKPGQPYFPFYAIPGIKRNEGKNVIGFLIINCITYTEILATIQSFGKVSNTDIELMFMYDIINDSKYRIYLNPLNEVFECDIETAKKLCSNAGNFINKTFRTIDIEDSQEIHFGPILTDSNVRIFQQGDFNFGSAR